MRIVDETPDETPDTVNPEVVNPAGTNGVELSTSDPATARPAARRGRKHRRVIRPATGGVSSTDQIVNIRSEDREPLTGLTAAEQQLIADRPPHW